MSEGWAAIPNWLVRDTTVSAYAKLLYTVIQSHAGSTGTTRLLQSTIAKEANVSAKTVERYLNELVSLGVLYWVAQGDATRRSASIFHPLAEPDKALVALRHKPAGWRSKIRTVSPVGTVSEAVLTEVKPQDSAVPQDSVPSVSPVGTVSQSAPQSTPVPSEGRYVPSERRREEEPSKKNPSSSSSSISPKYSDPYPGGGMKLPDLSWYPSREVAEQAQAIYPWATKVAMREVTMKVIAFGKSKGRSLDDSLWLTFMSNANKDREKVDRDEAEAKASASEKDGEKWWETGKGMPGTSRGAS